MKTKLILICLLTSICLAACGSAKKIEPEFSKLNFENTEEEMFSAEGKAVEEYPSLYNGVVYRYADKNYKDLNGSVKYMTDDKGNIACIAWLYESDSAEDIANAYEKIHDELVKQLGPGENASENVGNYGDIWYFDDVHVQISAVVTADYKGMQVSYMDAAYSLKDEVDKKKSK